MYRKQLLTSVIAVVVGLGLCYGILVWLSHWSPSATAPSEKGQATDLPQKDKDTFSLMGFEVGYSWGYWNPQDVPVYWVTPDKYESFHRQLYIPKGYWTMEDMANVNFPDGTPLNEKQKRQAMEAYNWMFYAGYCRGAQDSVQGKPYLDKP
ncbi:MAG: hypothetical protein MUO97_09365 [Dehalococcoidia bacterium]|nr:hypothetical protein [Dehalococcoidia bacterium]